MKTQSDGQNYKNIIMKYVNSNQDLANVADINNLNTIEHHPIVKLRMEKTKSSNMLQRVK